MVSIVISIYYFSSLNLHKRSLNTFISVLLLDWFRYRSNETIWIQKFALLEVQFQRVMGISMTPQPLDTSGYLDEWNWLSCY